MKKVIVVQSPHETVSGYGAKSRDIIRSLVKWADNNNFDIKLVPTPWGACPHTAMNNCDDRELFESRLLTAPLHEMPEIFVQITIPNEAQRKGKYNILFTSSIETTVCRGEWIEGLNRMDLVIVPSKHAKTAFISSKFKKKDHQSGQEITVEVKKDIEVLFEGSDLKIYNNKQSTTEATALLDNIPEDFCFLFVGHWLQGELGADRKDVGMLTKTFLETFKNRPNPPALVLKTSGANTSEVDKAELLNKLRKIEDSVDGNLPNVYLVHGEFTDDEMNSLYNHEKVKAHVSFTHGEGYGRPLQEASLSGKPVIASKWSGHLDFLDIELCTLLDGELRLVHPSAVNEWIIKESKWFHVNYSLAANKLIDVYRNYDKHLEKAERLRKKNEKEKSLQAMDVAMAKILDHNVPKFQEKVMVNLPKLNMGLGDTSQTKINLPKLTKIK